MTFFRRYRQRRLKRRLLREAVSENLELIRGTWMRRKRGRARVARAARWSAFLVGVPLAFAGSSFLVPTEPTLVLPAPVAAVPAMVSETPPYIGGFEPVAATFPVASAGLALSADAMAPWNRVPVPIGRSIFPFGVQTIVLDPGHGGTNRGTRAPGGQAEKEITLDIARRLRDLLEQSAYRVVMTRNGDAGISLEERASRANRARGDIFVSIHVNWIETLDTRGIETYYLGPTDDPFLSELAAKENRESGYSLADYRGMLDRVYTDMRRDESRHLGRAVQDSIYQALRKINPDLRNRGVKTAPFVVLIGSEMPAILAEVSCLSNELEARLLNEESYREYIAHALYRGIRNYAEGLTPANQRGTEG